MTPPPDFSSLSSTEKDALIRTLLARVDALIAENAALRERLTLPPKTVFHNGDSACFLIRPSRGKAVVGEFLGAVRPDFWVSDRLGAQMGWARTGHQACLAHLLRDVQYAIEAGDGAFAPAIKKVL